MSTFKTCIRGLGGAIALSALLAGCGSDNGGPPPSSTAPPVVVPTVPATVQGIATPSTVSVVTATNAG